MAIRNIISHSYVSVDFAVLWDVARNKLPELMSDFERIIDEIQETT
ncbi:MAG: HepT-like ribonuclease domain-containing protein [Rothia mucilaginosa]